MRDYNDFEGPSDEELAAAYRRYNAERGGGDRDGSAQSSAPRYVGTPRNAKHKQDWGGVAIK